MQPLIIVRSSRQLGGIERQLLDHACRLHAVGWPLQVLCLYRGKGEHPLAEAARRQGLPATTITDPGPLHPAAWLRLRRLLGAYKGLLHTCDVRSDVLVWLARPQGPQVAEAHGHTREGRLMTLWNRLDVFVLRRLHAVVAVSGAGAETLRRAGIRRLHVIGNSSAILAPSPPPSALTLPGAGPHLLYAGRHSPEKGLHVLLAAWPHLRHHLPSARLWVLGAPARGAYGKRISQALQQPGIQAQGFVPDVRPWLSAVHAVIVPSLQESWGMTAFEALAAGTPLVASSVGGLPVLCAGAPHAVLVPPDDPQALVQGVLQALAPAVPRGAGPGKRYMNQPRFDPGLRFARWLALYREIDPK